MALSAHKSAWVKERQVMAQRYQRGSLRREPRSGGKEVWVWRYRVHGVMKQEAFPVESFPTENDVWQHLERSVSLLNKGAEKPVPVAVTMGFVVDRYIKEYLPELSKATQDTDGSMLRVHIKPKWGETQIADIQPADVEKWLKQLQGENGKPLSGASRGRARRMMKQLFDRAMFWRLIPHEENPITLVKVRGVSRRQKTIVILTVAQVNALIAELPEPYATMVLIAAGLGLRVEEVVALKWRDFDFHSQTITIQQVYTHSALKEVPKTEASNADLPVSENILAALRGHRERNTIKSEWVFPSPVTGHPYSPDTILQKKIKPAVKKLGLPKIGWHTFRHTYKSWLGSGTATLTQQKDMLRHADISTTGNIYGGTPIEEMRPLHEAIASQLHAQSPATKA